MRTSFFDKSGMDTLVRPGNDFFSYANGGWVKKTVIPAEQARWGSFTQLAADNRLKTKTILEEVVQAHPKVGSTEQQVGDFYASGMDSARVQKRGWQPIKAELAKIRAITDYRQVVNHLITDASIIPLTGPPAHAFIGYYVAPDDRQSTLNRINFQQFGLSLPEKGYYTRTDEATRKIRTAFVTYADKLFTLTGIEPSSARSKAEAILAFETQLARSHKVPADLRDPLANYNKFAVADLTQQMAHLNWRGLLNQLGLQRVDTVLIAQPSYYQALDKLLSTTSIELLKDRLILDVLDYNAPLLSDDFVEAHFAFYGKALNGQQRPLDRWQRIAVRIDEELGDALGQLWIKKYFPPEAKKRMLLLVDNIQTVYRKRLENLDWMAPQTKAVALSKLNRFVKKIGYPDHWKSYSGLAIKRDDYFGNVQQTRHYRTHLELAKVNRPINRNEWLITPPTVDAYANPFNNEIVFPAGILQFPFFDQHADDAINYGGIGMVIGHEMTHLFDDQGRQYDANGNLRDWWTPQDANRFTAKAQAVVEQYNHYRVLTNQPVNGKLTLGENLADLGGVTLAYEAFKRTKQGQSRQKLDGFTPDQRFFLGFAQIWRGKFRDEFMRSWILTNPHSPVQFRVNGPLSNFAPFYRAFRVDPGQKLYKPAGEQTQIW